MNDKIYNNFLNTLEKRIDKKEFSDNLNKFILIDSKHYSKKICVEDFIRIIKEYREKNINIQNRVNSLQVLTIGNPEIIFRLGIEAVRNNLKTVFISINDFCLAQNKFIVFTLNEVFEDIKLDIKIEIDNLTPIDVLVENVSIYNKTISVSDSHRYYLLENKIDNIEFYPYNLFSLYTDSDEFDELKRKIFEVSSVNGFEFELYDDIENFEEAIDVMNNDGYGFCSIILSKDMQKCKIFKEKINSKYIVVNENPFKVTKFEIDL